jgi:hypothetical protein
VVWGAGVKSPRLPDSIHSSCFPDSWVALCVKDGNHRNRTPGEPVEHKIRESPDHRHPSRSVNNGIGFGKSEYSLEACIDAAEEIATQSGTPRLIPVDCLDQFLFGLRPDNQFHPTERSGFSP